MGAYPSVKETPALHKRSEKAWLVWIKRIILGFTIAFIALILLGLVYQMVGASNDKLNFPAPGRLVEMGGYQLHINCMGPENSGNPTVILETLSGGVSALWGWVQPEISRITRVCSYDRAGRGWSGPRSNPISLQQTSDDLHALLQKAGILGPYVLVGHSIGGIYARKFITDHPDEVAGLVLVDAAHPEQLERYPQLETEREAYLRVSALFPALARIGLFRLYFALGGETDFAGLPERQHDEVAVFWSSPEYFNSQRDETRAAPSIYSDGQALGGLGDLPLAVVTQGNAQPFWVELQNELATLSSDSIHITVPGSNHGSLAINQPHARETSAAILKVVDAVRDGKPVSSK